MTTVIALTIVACTGLWGGWRWIGDVLFTHQRLCAWGRATELRQAYQAALAVAAGVSTEDALRAAQSFADGISFQLDVQRAMCRSMHKPTKADRLAWATEAELRRELRRRAWRRWLHRRLGSSTEAVALIRRSKR